MVIIIYLKESIIEGVEEQNRIHDFWYNTVCLYLPFKMSAIVPLFSKFFFHQLLFTLDLSLLNLSNESTLLLLSIQFFPFSQNYTRRSLLQIGLNGSVLSSVIFYLLKGLFCRIAPSLCQNVLYILTFLIFKH